MGHKQYLDCEEQTIVRVVGPVEWSTRVRCHECFLVLEVIASDVKYRDPAVLGEQAAWPRFYVTCVSCGKDVSLHAVPPHIQSQVRGESVPHVRNGTLARR
jgi:hypothetical protein